MGKKTPSAADSKAVRTPYRTDHARLGNRRLRLGRKKEPGTTVNKAGQVPHHSDAAPDVALEHD